MFGRDTPKVLVIEKGARLNDEQMRDAFQVGETVLWWRALIQIIQDLQLTSLDNAYDNSSKNNPLALSASIGAHGILTDLLDKLSELRDQSTK